MKDYRRSTSRMTSIFENELNIQIPLCNVRILNGILRDFSGNLSKKDALTEKKYLGDKLLFLKFLRELQNLAGDFQN